MARIALQGGEDGMWTINVEQKLGLRLEGCIDSQSTSESPIPNVPLFLDLFGVL